MQLSQIVSAKHPRLRFGADASSGPDETSPAETLKQAEAIITNKILVDSSNEGATNGYQKAKKQVDDRKSSHTSSKWVLGGTMAFSLFINAFVNLEAELANASYNKLSADRKKDSYEKFQMEQAAEARYCFAALSAFFILVTGMIYRGTRSDLNKAKEALKASANQLTLTAATNRVEKDLNTLLSQRIETDAQTVIDQMHTLSEAHPEAGEMLRESFGNKDKMPSKEQVVGLFRYYAYQLIQSRRFLAGEKMIRPTTELEHHQQVYALLQAGLASGSMFDFVRSKPDAPHQQSFNESFLQITDAAEALAKQETEALEPLLLEGYELEEKRNKGQELLNSLQTAGNFGTMTAESIPAIQAMLDRFNERLKADAQANRFHGFSPEASAKSGLDTTAFWSLIDGKTQEIKQQAVDSLKACVDDLEAQEKPLSSKSEQQK